MSNLAASAWLVTGTVAVLYALGCGVARSRARRAAVARHGDAERLLKVQAALAEIWRDEPPPELTLTDAVSSRVRFRARGQPARLYVARQAVDASPAELRGELAHEYAHVIDPVIRGEMLLVRLATFLLACGTPFVTYALLGIRPSSLGDFWLSLAIECPTVTAIALCASAVVSRARELRTDAAAVELLGSVFPVLATLTRIHDDYLTRPLYYRVAAQLSHPHPADRVLALMSAAVAAIDTEPMSRPRV